MSTILCIDDELDILEEYAATLEDEGYRVLKAANGEEGLEAIIAHGPDLVVCDVTMPRMNGYELVSKLRQNHAQHADTPFIFLSALADRHDVVKGLELGADEYLTKPVDFDLLIAKVKSRLRQVERMEAKKSQEFEHMAHHDPLTGLANRVQLRERLQDVLRNCGKDENFAVLFLDLDRFKTVNDTLGHTVGDELLMAVGARLRDCVGETDTVARLGGDEFAIVRMDYRQPEDAEDFAKRIRKELQVAFDSAGYRVLVDTSIGIAIGPADGITPEQLLKYADLALYEAKRHGRGRYEFFKPEMAARMEERRTLEFDLRAALEKDQLEIYYQPFFSLKEDRLVGFEALLRWHHPKRGLVLPGDFIPIAEETGLINPIGDWVLHQACAKAVTWPDDLIVAINVSVVQIRSETLPLKVANALAKSGLPASRLELEITESMLLESDERVLAVLNQLRELGVAVAIDDFGVGYSGLGYMQSFHFDKVKIDRSLVGNASQSTDAIAIVKAVRELAKALNISTTAEGVETILDLSVVKKEGCDYAQGFLLGRPQSADAIAIEYFPSQKLRRATAS